MSLNKTVIITGASSGIGLGLVKAFLARGYNVVGNARSPSGLDTAAAELGHPAGFIGVAGDIADPATSTALISQAVAAFGAVDGLVNNAGFFLPKPFVEYSPQDLDALLDTNLKGLVYASQAAAAHMIGRQQGFIINISAAVALQPNIQVPAALPVLIKGGVNQMTRALALELSPHNIKVNAIAPGIIDTPMHDPAHREFLDNLAPAGRVGTVEEIAEAVLYLAGADFTTGAILPVDGGMSTGKW
ncbi:MULTISPECIES: SDR family NAD(P)-dependent oxidoreductase [Pseudomonas]|jgi:Dehydrogenases with different specificities (related to short-chain alcohol dehydrogenases)|uniref:Putative short-chain dehydrogenase/reductase n=2 Tax=Pseudomonas TaxID=286 RepID=F2K7J0_PSEBN|nr:MULTISPECIES: SDR family NAD(P)-dependent oxidoreductase [Pseudomonas]EIK67040.1 oxidoreductase, short chain dehydrogenase/reductase family [Pseudomonas fluorescens Q8r1-96]AEA69501.1 putative short-chain dehydrogenase/reductase [Pseudomonas brassicacearum subsp. brassicacearum NFM421]KAB0520097.1 SDR family oxidoreductase [Pseudomonas brassicacearum subsp. brassicacearum]NJP61688.1 SDR family oxidoreductase [Pseudomonas brassicacearum]ROM87936.1 3-oxoacyl-ACP reductase [Pseudomonas brassic